MLVTGAGPVGLLAALIGVQYGFDVHVLDRVTEGPKPQLVHDLGATYHSGVVTDVGFEPDVIVECTGVGSVIVDSIRTVGSGGVVCSSPGWAAVPERQGGAVACTTEQTRAGRGSAVGRPARRAAAGGHPRGARLPRPRRRRRLARFERVYDLPWTIGMITPVEGDDGWLLGAGRGFVHLALDGTHRTIAEVSPSDTRMNDGACDPQGRFSAGTWPTTTTKEVARSTGSSGTVGWS